jgi:hypothetical protein
MSHWISIADKLPEIGQRVLAYRPTAEATHDDKIMLVVFTGTITESWQGVKHRFGCICHPTHWMAAPKEPTP